MVLILVNDNNPDTYPQNPNHVFWMWKEMLFEFFSQFLSHEDDEKRFKPVSTHKRLLKAT